MISISKGDFVQVDFNFAQITLTRCAEVVGIPCASGDSWKIIPQETGKLTYISEGCTLTLVDRPTAKPTAETCKWKRCGDKLLIHPCSGRVVTNDTKDCPTCGKRIEVVE